LVLEESIISSTGINSESLQVGIKGDPSLRETALYREKYLTILDERVEEIMPVLMDLLLNRGIYRLFIGYNSASVRTSSIFDPMREEIHNVEKLLDKEYVNRHFPKIEYEEKAQAMRELYRFLRNSETFKKIPHYWQNISEKRGSSWSPMPQEEVQQIISTLQQLRDQQGYYLRNVTICIVQSVVRLEFNCDGTQVVKGGNYKQFLELNLP
ncbi:MAG: hypothetical protein OQK13_04240, partial [Gammaproteobacteria bacterium]|nr:hypothetical protein [Gammaproteobacteria bacterium]